MSVEPVKDARLISEIPGRRSYLKGVGDLGDSNCGIWDSDVQAAYYVGVDWCWISDFGCSHVKVNLVWALLRRKHLKHLDLQGTICLQFIIFSTCTEWPIIFALRHQKGRYVGIVIDHD